jgi:hypothetical protein
MPGYGASEPAADSATMSAVVETLAAVIGRDRAESVEQRPPAKPAPAPDPLAGISGRALVRELVRRPAARARRTKGTVS